MKKFLLAAIACAVGAGGTFAYVRAEGEPSGYVGKGQVVVRTSLGGPNNQITLGGDIAMEQLGPRLRVDVLSLAIPGAGATISALLGTQLFPPGGFSIVYDREASSFTVWSPSQHKFYTSSSFMPPPNAPAPNAPPGYSSQSSGNGSDLFGVFGFAKALKNYNDFQVSVGLAGHQTVNGHPATGLNFNYVRTTRDNDTIDLHGTFQFADDLDGVPVEITVGGKTKSLPESAFRLDFQQLVKQTPPESDFFPPQGYARAGSIGEVIGKNLQLPGT